LAELLAGLGVLGAEGLHDVDGVVVLGLDVVVQRLAAQGAGDGAGGATEQGADNAALGRSADQLVRRDFQAGGWFGHSRAGVAQCLAHLVQAVTHGLAAGRGLVDLVRDHRALLLEVVGRRTLPLFGQLAEGPGQVGM
jgi:hypothetical protein